MARFGEKEFPASREPYLSKDAVIMILPIANFLVLPAGEGLMRRPTTVTSRDATQTGHGGPDLDRSPVDTSLLEP